MTAQAYKYGCNTHYIRARARAHTHTHTDRVSRLSNRWSGLRREKKERNSRTFYFLFLELAYSKHSVCVCGGGGWGGGGGRKPDASHSSSDKIIYIKKKKNNYEHGTITINVSETDAKEF